MRRRTLMPAGTLMGIGMGGFLDSILFHQILQLHSMLSARLPATTISNIERSMLFDGVFEGAAWITTALAVGLFWRASKQRSAPWSGRTFGGSLIMGWGLFNLIEGLIDHHILGIHHVVERMGLSIFDYAFLASGVFLIFSGLLLIRAGARDRRSRINLRRLGHGSTPRPA